MAAAQINRSFSAFLDLLRIVSALVVFFAHFAVLPRTGAASLLPYLEPYQHSAVMVFFVLSGYLISLAAAREGDAVTYAIDRAARIYSVVIPALVLTYGIDIYLHHDFPGSVDRDYQLLQPWKYVPLFLAFATDFWFLAENAFSNVPYWSLSYEVWYYVVFGIVFFGREPVRGMATALALVAMGPRLWLLLPVWVLGVALQHAHRRMRLGRNGAGALLALGLAGIVVLKLAHVEDGLNGWFNQLVGGFASEKLRYSKSFLGDYAFAAMTGLVILAARDAHIPGLARAKAPIAALASVSFSLYLVHYPTLQLFDSLLPGRPVTIVLLTLAVVAAFGILFERRKNVLRRWLRLAADTLMPGSRVVAGTPDAP